ncbi:MAG: four helix bundle protein [Candidatus Moranbacteria bacterium CG10_big_fil_rev_8_21_14_0_10_35_21]|nr:MAG: four helix bundle protein [Candidatus Moranbacteria bacterium CG10_big_fil_rev_8_21_14_0_10_35_21]PJA88885.1 MAG: four helix bundle protein [Candidatus Moranbacteria bacterium CG_4_9_14_3_um_filter_36_9]
MTNTQNKNKFDLEERTAEFAKRVIRLCKSLPKDSINNRLTGQTAGSAGSVGANYREANDALGKKDFIHRMKISRKEAKETLHWLELIEEDNPEFKSRIQELKQEGMELKNILLAIIKKTENKQLNI